LERFVVGNGFRIGILSVQRRAVFCNADSPDHFECKRIVSACCFAIATGLPVILFAWLLAFAVGNVGKMYNRIKVFELWFRRVVSIVFIGIGIYYIVILWV